eukprot:TRINITY_DN4505_c3_g1_i1.p2 TRINITY_DN4505_c3_g1~~TRINITY_DN4505_c3_g1_i1.p2  ORF type:complete len:132 (-),score=21.24 TRINITY_DN4505_c3_g1_i1:116-511(-)
MTAIIAWCKVFTLAGKTIGSIASRVTASLNAVMEFPIRMRLERFVVRAACAVEAADSVGAARVDRTDTFKTSTFIYVFAGGCSVVVCKPSVADTLPLPAPHEVTAAGVSGTGALGPFRRRATAIFESSRSK